MARFPLVKSGHRRFMGPPPSPLPSPFPLCRFPALPYQYSKELQQMVRDCLDQSPEKRPTMEGILSCQAVKARLHLVPNADGMVMVRVGRREGYGDGEGGKKR